MMQRRVNTVCVKFAHIGCTVSSVCKVLSLLLECANVYVVYYCCVREYLRHTLLYENVWEKLNTTSVQHC